MKQCRLDDCDKPVHGNGLCDTHYQRVKNRGDPVKGTRSKVAAGTRCSIDRCTRLHYRRTFCKPHYQRLRKYGDPLGGAPLPEEIDIDGMRLCTKCGIRKPLETGFAPQAGSRGGRSRICRECKGKRLATWYEANREDRIERSRICRIKRLYGETGLEVEQRRQAGDGCDACGRRIEPMAIDHCHATGQTRGLLCKPCNFILGIVEDDPDRLRLLADYLEAFSDSLDLHLDETGTNASHPKGRRPSSRTPRNSGPVRQASGRRGSGDGRRSL